MNYCKEPNQHTLMGRLKLRSHNKDLTAYVSLLEHNPDVKLLDVGCGMGLQTLTYALKVDTFDITGIDVKNWGVTFRFIEGDLDLGLPFTDGAFDVVTSYHVIEHVTNTDLLAREMFRVLKIGGYALIGTPNLASGKVVLELLLDKQPDVAYISDYFRIRGGTGQNWKKSEGRLHRRLFTSEGLERLLSFYGFRIEKSLKVGYGPLPLISNVLRGLYAGNLIVKARKV